MPTEYLKKATKTPETEAGAAQKVAGEMLADIEARGEAAVREYAARLDRWTGDILVSPEVVERRTRDIPEMVKRDIEFATGQVRNFAIAQRESIREFETEVLPGLFAGREQPPSRVSRLRKVDLTHDCDVC